MKDKAKDKERFDKWLKAYSMAAAGALALAPAAEAAVIYGSGPLAVFPGSAQTLDIDGDGNVDFMVDTYTFGSFVYFVRLSSYGYSGSGHINEFTHNDPANLPTNYLIGPTLNGANFWDSNPREILNGSLTDQSTPTSTMGNFNGATGLIGVMFNSSACGNPTYAWIRYQGLTRLTGTVIDWAYEDNCQPIMAGEMPPADVPALDKWGALAMVALMSGAAAVALRRKERKAKA